MEVHLEREFLSVSPAAITGLESTQLCLSETLRRYLFCVFCKRKFLFNIIQILYIDYLSGVPITDYNKKSVGWWLKPTP